MNYLELVKRLAQEAGTIEPDKITTVAGQTGHIRDLVTWINQAWYEIQLMHDNWRWMVKKATMTLTADQDTYTKVEIIAQIPDFDEIVPFTADHEPRYILVDQGGNTHSQCWYYEYENFRGLHDRWVETSSFPQRYTTSPDESIIVDPAPQDALALEFDYRLQRQNLTQDTDVPLLPERFHMAIVYRALWDHAGYDEANVQFQRAERLYRRYKRWLLNDQLPDYTVPGVN